MELNFPNKINIEISKNKFYVFLYKNVSFIKRKPRIWSISIFEHIFIERGYNEQKN